jgi:hypothetical protein
LVGELRKEKTQLFTDLQRAETLSGIVFTEVDDVECDTEDVKGREDSFSVPPLVQTKSFIKRHGTFIRRTSCDDCNILENTGCLRTAAGEAVRKSKGGMDDSALSSPKSVAFSDDTFRSSAPSGDKQEEKKLLLRHSSHSHGLKLVSFERADSLLKVVENNSRPPLVKQKTAFSSSSSTVVLPPLKDRSSCISTSSDSGDGKGTKRPASAGPRIVNGIPSYLRPTASSKRLANLD